LLCSRAERLLISRSVHPCESDAVLHAVTLPILDLAGIPIAALSVSAIASRKAKSRQIDLLKILQTERNRVRRRVLLRESTIK
jgi:DNA-binding IclR family transcriptional regulator